ncbi:hypothetical protein RHGRI_018237 [Rhododendron griersonianum]|uniref:Uncharacterized protein n=1 Tax=Rhododendron griersonianum TaxID=479676 RepID=A0AAV6K0Q4_9ERIC|nr:hypothetical protein RHGRI_018237 [Rhododendron griersonianum]
MVVVLLISRSHLESILVTSFTIAAILFALPREYKGDVERGGSKTLVPTVIFNSLPPSTFHVFLLSLIFAFTFSLSALLIHDSSSDDTATNKSSHSRQHLVVKLFGCSSLASIASALAILFRALLLTATASSSSFPSPSLLRLFRLV